jgi:hypothetical protein
MPPTPPSRSHLHAFRRACARLAHALRRLGAAAFHALFAAPPAEQLWTYFLPADMLPPGPIAARALRDLLWDSDAYRWN